MKRNLRSPDISGTEWKQSFLFFLFLYLLLPSLLNWLLPGADSVLQNLIFYGIGFAGTVFFLRSFLSGSFRQLLVCPGRVFYCVLLGLGGCMLLTGMVNAWLLSSFPGFRNLNNDTIQQLSLKNAGLMAVCIVGLAPVVEECFFRGLLFRKLYSSNRWAAYLLSMVCFSALHMLGSLGQSDGLSLLLGFVQYLPAGLCLARCYVEADCIFAPIAVHGLFNALSLYQLYH